MISRFCCAILLLLAFWSCSLPIDTPQEGGGIETTSVSGVVRLSDGRPAARAQVRIDGRAELASQHRSTVADDSGAYRFDSVQTGNWLLSAKNDSGAVLSSIDLHVPSGGRPVVVPSVSLAPAARSVAVVDGLAKSSNNTPLPQWRIELVGLANLSGIVKSTTTDDSGSFRFDSVQVGNWRARLKDSVGIALDSSDFAVSDTTRSVRLLLSRKSILPVVDTFSYVLSVTGQPGSPRGFPVVLMDSGCLRYPFGRSNAGCTILRDTTDTNGRLAIHGLANHSWFGVVRGLGTVAEWEISPETGRTSLLDTVRLDFALNSFKVPEVLGTSRVAMLVVGDYARNSPPQGKIFFSDDSGKVSILRSDSALLLKPWTLALSPIMGDTILRANHGSRLDTLAPWLDSIPVYPTP